MARPITCDAADDALRSLERAAALIDEELNSVPETDQSRVEVEALRMDDERLQEMLRGDGPLWREWRALWMRLAANERDAAAHPAWLASWLNCYALGADRDLRVFVCRADEHLLAVLPFEVVPQSTPLGAACELRLESVAPLEGASLAVRAAEFPRVCTALFEMTLDDGMRPAALVFDQVDESHAVLETDQLHCRTETATPRSVIDIAGGYDALLESVGGNFRGNLRRSRNKLEKLAGVRLDELVTPRDMHVGVKRFEDVERRSWKAQDGTDLAADAPMRAFYLSALPRLAAAGEAMIHVLHADGVDIAAQISLRRGSRMDVHKISFADAYSNLSPGNLLLERVMREAAPRHGITRVNLVTHQPWHARWKPDLIRTYRVRIFPSGLRGAWARAWFVPAKDRARSWLDRTGLLAPLRAVKNAAANVAPASDSESNT